MLLDDPVRAAEAVSSLKKMCHKDLYPNTPIEVKDCEGRIHFSVEGQWDSYEYTYAGAKKHLQEILKVNSRNWSGEYLKLYPEWGGWEKINQTALEKRCKKLVPHDATLAD